MRDKELYLKVSLGGVNIIVQRKEQNESSDGTLDLAGGHVERFKSGRYKALCLISEYLYPPPRI